MVEQRIKLSKSVLDGKLVMAKDVDIQERVVRDLWIPNNIAWDSDWVRELPITPNGRMDRVIWFHNDHRGGDRHSALKKCPKALAILALGGLDGQFLGNDYERCIDWLEDAMRVLDKKAFEDLIMILWNGWNGRNNAIFRGKDEDAGVIWERAKMLGDDFRIHNLTIKPILPLTPSPQKWEKPPINFVKVNVDAVVVDNKTRFGVVICDCDGFILGGSAGYKGGHMSTEWAELFALIEGITLAHLFNFNTVIFESDCANLVNRF
ncbi:hypothetical protein Gorai_000064 [Gossypium raimondii]|uniref:RNase H type-1 domain-containing protein n=1 Tax=Gossypium raimondii TaxID=29730 RepID=A0A7J8PCQ0_GOSRA|nr:hypothetical protein [Gossypium raimondii]